MTELTFAVADLHGRRDLLDEALAAVAAYASGGTLVFLGDYIDRGPWSADVLARLIAGPPAGWRWVCLMGNHEAMMGQALRDPEQFDLWIDNGGEATLASYAGDTAEMAAHLAWIEGLATMHVDAHRIYVHAGIDSHVPLERQVADTLLWKRYRHEADAPVLGRHVVHGHDPVSGGPLCLAHRTDLDTHAWRTGRLVVGVFDDAVTGGPVDLLEVSCAVASAIG